MMDDDTMIVLVGAVTFFLCVALWVLWATNEQNNACNENAVCEEGEYAFNGCPEDCLPVIISVNPQHAWECKKLNKSFEVCGDPEFWNINETR